MPAYGISLQDTATPLIEELSKRLDDGSWRAPLGEAMATAVKDHFADKEQDPRSHATAKRLGAKPVGLFAAFARATNWRVTAGGVEVSIAHVAIRQHLEGGTIKPVNGKYLTIPNVAQAYGRRASEFGETLSGMFRRDKSGRIRAVALVKNEYADSDNVPDDGIYYWLVDKVTTQGDPDTIPSESDLTETATTMLSGWVAAMLKRSGGTS